MYKGVESLRMGLSFTCYIENMFPHPAWKEFLESEICLLSECKGRKGAMLFYSFHFTKKPGAKE